MPGSSNYSSTVRHQVQEILSKPPYRNSQTPRPLAGMFHAIGRGLDWAIGRPARWLYHHSLLHIGHAFTLAFGGWWPVVAGALAVGFGALAGVMLVRRRTRVSAKEVTTASIGGPLEDPDDLDSGASAAEGSGDHETAVRLRFRAGLLRLARRGIITDYNAQTGRQLSQRLHSPTFDALARRHEVIVYGRDPATSSDAATARNHWPRVLVEARPGPGNDRPAADDHRTVVGSGSR